MRDPVVEVSWIEVALIDKQGQPVEGAHYEITPAGGTTRSGTLDDQGAARVDDIPPGDCRINFPDFSPSEWGGIAASGGSLYSVVQGDCLSRIASRFGFVNWHTIYDAPENADFRTLRPNPNIIFPGDGLFIPRKAGPAVTRPTGGRHVFNLLRVGTKLRLRIESSVSFSYRITVGDQSREGTLDPGGIIEMPIMPDADDGQLSVWPNGDRDKDPIEWDLLLGQLDPVEEVTGVQARLNNLGYSCGKVDGIVGPKTEAALRDFQEMCELVVSGQIDAATRVELRRRHDEE